VDWDSLSQSAQQTAQQGWTLAVDYFNKAKQLVGSISTHLVDSKSLLTSRFLGDGYSNMNDEQGSGSGGQGSNSYAGQGANSNLRASGSQNSYNGNASGGFQRGQGGAPSRSPKVQRNDDDVWNDWDGSLPAKSNAAAPAASGPSKGAAAARVPHQGSEDMWDFDAEPANPPRESEQAPEQPAMASPSQRPASPAQPPSASVSKDAAKWDDDGWDKNW